MAFPEYVPTRVVTVGGAISVEDADSLLRVAVEIRSSHSLIWDATGYRFEKTGKAAISELGTEVSVILPRTDVDGWKDAATGAYIDVSEPDSYTHRYTAVIRFINQDGRTIGTTYTVGPFVLPAGTGAVDLDKMVPASSIPGGQVSIPDVWSQMVAAAEAAATAAQAALIDSAQFVADEIGTPGTPANVTLSTTYGPAAVAESQELRDAVGTVVASQAAPALAGVGTRLAVYGDSYGTPARGLVNGLATELGMTLSAFAVGGDRTDDTAYRVVGNYFGSWSEGADVVTVINGLNDMQAADTAAHRAMSYEALRSIVAVLSAGGRVEQSAMTPSGTWNSQTHPHQCASGGTVSITTTEGASLSFTPDEPGDWYLLTEAYNGVGLVAGGFDVVQGARTVAKTYSNGRSAIADAANIATNDYMPQVVRLRDLVAGVPVTFTFSKRGLSGTVYGAIDGLLRPSRNPPLICLVKPLPVISGGYNKPALMTYVRETRDLVAAEFGPHVVVADALPGWDTATMIEADQIHASPAGNAHIRAAVVAAIRAGVTTRTRGAKNWRTVVRDTFHRPPSNTSLTSTDTEGVPWVANVGTWGIVDSTGRDIDASGTAHLASIDHGNLDRRITAHLTGTTVGGVIFRMVDNEQFLAVTRTGVVYRYNTGGGNTQVGNPAVTIPAPADCLMEVTIRGNWVTVAINGQVVTGFNCPDYATSTKDGLRNVSLATEFRLFQVEALA